MPMLTEEFKAEEAQSAVRSTLDSLSVFGASYKTAGLELRSHLNFTGEKGFQLLQSLASAGLRQCLVLSTCNRTEVYYSGSDSEIVLNVLSLESGIDRHTLRDHSYSYVGEPAARHLFRVACGLESAALGETEILSQLKEALRAAGEGGHLCGALNLLFRRSLEVSKRVRSETALCKNVTSVASMAVRQAAVAAGGLQGKSVLLLGAGAIAERVAKELNKVSDISCTVANRTLSRAEALASEYNFKFAALAELEALLDNHQVVFCAINAEKPLLNRDALSGKSLTIADLGVPSIVEDLGPGSHCQIINMEFLASACSANSDLRSGSVEDAEKIIEDGVQEFVAECQERDVAPAIEALVRLGEQVRNENLNWALVDLAGLTAHERKTVEDMSRRIVRGMLQGQIAAMKSQSLSSQERACLASVFKEIGPGTGRD